MASESFTGSVINGIWKVGELISCSCFTKIYEAQNETGQNAVVKISRSIDMSEHQNECMVYRRLSERGLNNYCAIYSMETSKSKCISVMQRLEETLFDYRGRQGLLPLKFIINVGHQILCRLEELNNIGLCHGDIHDENVMISTDSQGQKEIYLVDFGFAKWYDITSGKFYEPCFGIDGNVTKALQYDGSSWLFKRDLQQLHNMLESHIDCRTEGNGVLSSFKSHIELIQVGQKPNYMVLSNDLFAILFSRCS